ncbi:MAG: septum formation initiator family protein [Hyphomicrobiales bacterium]|jgi:cell division protein FtsB|nr:septum formation initiator family protein [Hyphomicrobiales bacterium]|tara:strand:- start:283 stop:594 length:312 start_codon:yes stop_codon:yes gene_type:complete
MFLIRLKRYISYLTLPILLILFLSYISYHTFISNAGLSKNLALKSQLLEVNAELLVLHSDKARLKKHITLLKKNIDADMLEEKAKRILYYAHPNEIIINTNIN